MIEQGTPEWKAQRIGKVTASRVADVIAKVKTGVSASRTNYEAQIICERLTGVAVEGYTNAAMQHGIDTEPQARSAYEFMRNVDVVLAEFVDHPRVPMSGASPDGFVDDDGLIEIKCPQQAAHLETLLSRKVPAKYVTQMMWQMAATERKWCDFVSYNPTFPPHLQLFVQRVHRDEAMISELEREVLAFLADVDRKVSQLQPRAEAA
jgi:putative phage-type endonuclease